MADPNKPKPTPKPKPKPKPTAAETASVRRGALAARPRSRTPVRRTVQDDNRPVRTPSRSLTPRAAGATAQFLEPGERPGPPPEHGAHGRRGSCPGRPCTSDHGCSSPAVPRRRGGQRPRRHRRPARLARHRQPSPHRGHAGQGAERRQRAPGVGPGRAQRRTAGGSATRAPARWCASTSRSAPGAAANSPDGWVLLQTARGPGRAPCRPPARRARPRRAASRASVPEPLRRRPSLRRGRTPYDEGHSGAVGTLRRVRGSGGRQPIRVRRRPAGAQQDASRAGGRWSRRSTRAAASIRGSTAWCTPTSVSAPTRSATSTPTPTRRMHPDLVGPLDGGIDALAGHGTFIAGLIHQACPDADIVAWRVVGVGRPDRRERPRQGTQGHRGGGAAAPRRRAGRPPDRRAQPVLGLLPRDAAGRAVRPDDVRHPARAGRVRRRGGLLGRQRRHRPTLLPRRLVPVAGSGQDARGGRPRRGAHRLGRCAQPQRHRRVVQQRRAVGSRPRLRRVGDEHAAARSRAASARGRAEARPTVASASPSTPTTTARSSRCGAARRSRHPCSPDGSPSGARSHRPGRTTTRAERRHARVGRGGRPDGHHAMMG